MSFGIPVVDLADSKEPDEWNRNVGVQLRKAFQSAGACYITNHGLDEEFLADFLSASREFFEQPISKKSPYSRRPGEWFGWLMLESEALNPDRPGDMKETFNYAPAEDVRSWSNDTMRFRQLNQRLFASFSGLVSELFDALSVDLGLQDKAVLRSFHSLVGKPGNTTGIRSLYYPPIDPNADMKPGQIRCGEHTDYGSITLLYQDDAGGLEVQVPGGDFIPVPPVPGTLLVLVGAMMQRWTSDRLTATNHRVVSPGEGSLKAKCRQSVVFFVKPDNDLVVNCLDGSKKYEPISYIDYLNYRLDAARKY